VGGVDVLALDVSLEEGGKINSKKLKKKQKKNKQDNSNNDGNAKKAGNLVIRHGTPKSLSEDDDIRNSNRTLFLCYPDEEDFQPEEDEEDDDDEDAPPPMSMAASCLEHFTGSTIIHVGELFGDTLSLDQAPFGRSSSNEFQQRLAGEYHCILKMKLQNNWLHVRDTLSVWKRSETCCMAFANDDDEDDDDDGDGEDEEVYYKYIPPEELLPVDLAAPCVAHLLSSNKNSNGSNMETHANGDNTEDDVDSASADAGELDKKVETSPTSSSGGKNKKKRKKKKNNDSSDSDDNDDKQEITTSDVDPWDSNDEQEIVAGSAW